MRADYAYKATFDHILSAMCWCNRLAIETSLATGLRISDVLSLRTDQVRNTPDGRVTVREAKTGKLRTVRLCQSLVRELMSISGKVYIFEHRLDYRRHRTRQAVYKDIVRACRAFRLPKSLHLTPHSARKFFAVSKYQQTGNLDRVRKLLNHDDESVTMIYAMADEITARRQRRA